MHTVKGKQLTLFDFPKSDVLVDPIHATFQGGRGEPLHDWYPYLEGYSDEFVRFVVENYMPDAHRVIDPFAGSGTTPLVLGARSILCGYCEVNPVMRHVIDTKLSVACLPFAKRKALYDDILRLAEELRKLTSVASPDDLLNEAYLNVFGDSIFFDEKTYQEILRLRSVNDSVKKKNPLLGNLLSTAIMSRLVLCSRLKRAGDLRFKTHKELAKGVPALLTEVVSQLNLIANDCLTCPYIPTHPKLLVCNAKELNHIDPFNADGIITSPPYLNGTNYFRNTKLELWYHRHLTHSKHLRYYRDEAITAGINDVVKSKDNKQVFPKVAEIVVSLEESAYDQRIPKMVESYFYDMGIVFSALAHHTIPGAVVCIDIGDSIYGGIHIPTQNLIVEIGKAMGFEPKEIVNLRKRLSKNGSQLSQDLVVLVRKNSKVLISKPSLQTYPIQWKTFKSTLPHQKYPFTKRNWGHPLHSICSYQGKLKPSLAFHLVECFSEPGDAVLDPFSGSGSIPFEAALNGRRAFGLDISLLATVISNAKLQPANQTKVDKLLANLDAWIHDNPPTPKAIAAASNVRFNRPIPEYYHPKTFNEILAARDFFRHYPCNTPEWYLVFACMLHILHGNRPYALSRNSHPVTPFVPTGPREYKPVIEKLREKVIRSLNVDYPPQFTQGVCYQSDILGPWPENLSDIDVIITSPPFFDSTRFYMTNWIRYWFCGWDREDFEKEPVRFVESVQKKSLNIYEAILCQFKERLKAKGIAVFHLGNSKKCDMASELSYIAKKYFKILDIFDESVTHCESHGVRDKGTVTSHKYLVLGKG